MSGHPGVLSGMEAARSSVTQEPRGLVELWKELERECGERLHKRTFSETHRTVWTFTYFIVR